MNKVDTNPNTVHVLLAGSSVGNWAAWTAGVTYKLAVVLRGSRGWIVMISGGAYPEWTILNIHNQIIQGTLRPALTPYSGGGWFDNAYVSDLGGQWNTDGCFGLTSSYVANPTNGQVATGTSNGFVTVNWTPAASETLELGMRRSNETNKLIIRCRQSSNTVEMWKMVNGVESGIKTNARTFTVGTPVLVSIRLDGSSIQPLIGGTYTAPATDAFNSTSTGIEYITGGATNEDWAMWPTVVTGVSARQQRYPSQVNIWAYGDSKTAGTGDFDGQNYNWSLGATHILNQIGNSVEIPSKSGNGGFTLSSFTNNLSTNVFASCDRKGLRGFNIAVNDSSGTNAAWIAKYSEVVDRIHTNWPSAIIGCAIPWSDKCSHGYVERSSDSDFKHRF